MGNTCGCASESAVLEAGTRAKRSGIPQVVLLGLDGAGKTTLLYRTYFAHWHDIASHMEPTVGFNYEEVNKLGMQIGVWDLAGRDSVRQLWPIFYKWIEVSAVVMLVSLTDTRADRIAEVRRHIRLLVNEDELRNSYFAVVLNSFGAEGSVGMIDPDKMIRNLGLTDAAVAHKDVSTYIVNVKDADSDANWQRCLFNITQHIRTMANPPKTNSPKPDQPAAKATPKAKAQPKGKAEPKPKAQPKAQPKA
eukprot:Selendium_serpulae@DN4186_c0_g1_i1.p1